MGRRARHPEHDALGEEGPALFGNIRLIDLTVPLGHQAPGEYRRLGKLANLDRLPRPHGFVSCLPVKVEGASAGWCRAVALVPEG